MALGGLRDADGIRGVEDPSDLQDFLFFELPEDYLSDDPDSDIMAAAFARERQRAERREQARSPGSSPPESVRNASVRYIRSDTSPIKRQPSAPSMQGMGSRSASSSSIKGFLQSPTRATSPPTIASPSTISPSSLSPPGSPPPERADGLRSPPQNTRSLAAAVNDRLKHYSPVNLALFPAPTPPTYSILSDVHLVMASHGPAQLRFIPPPVGAAPDSDEFLPMPCLVLPSTNSRHLLLHFHANSEDLGGTAHNDSIDCGELELLRAALRCHVVSVEYPGYGICLGQPSELTLKRAAERAFAYLTTDPRGPRWNVNEIILFGRSIGTGAAIHLAASHPVAAMVLVTPYTSLKAVVRSLLGRTAAFVFSERFDSVSAAVDVRCPTVLVHGEQDELIPFSHSRELLRALGTPPQHKVLCAVKTATHNTISIRGQVAEPALHFFKTSCGLSIGSSHRALSFASFASIETAIESNWVNTEPSLARKWLFQLVGRRQTIDNGTSASTTSISS
eukprot:TRINITY_DN12410_c0_g1_i1.p1 TRINITY_DN12410_c0_g1~~TRINITY_DN12410_c0_g1_i1.p1  ORF type:complete len:507 (+),score=102.08 TRINITY_DN12410_c0_g1_i1:173-1693(+)